MARQDPSTALLLCMGWCVCVALGEVLTVQPGQDVVLSCEARNASGSYTQWLQMCPNSGPRFVQQNRKFSYKKSTAQGCYDLHIVGVAEDDVCLYFFALVEKEQNCDYMFERTQTRLTLAGSEPVALDPSCPVVPTAPPSLGPGVRCSLPWTLLLAACCLLAALLALRVCCNTCHREKEMSSAEYQVDAGKYHQCERTLRGLDCHHTEVTYRLISTEAS